MSKNLYIISGCNGAGKTTASYTVLPKILECKEFVNADEIAKGLSPFNPESVAFEAGITNLFARFMNEVDLWMIYDNSRTPRTFVAKGGKSMATSVESEMLYYKIKSYVR